jgi:hypothetical protein
METRMAVPRTFPALFAMLFLAANAASSVAAPVASFHGAPLMHPEKDTSLALNALEEEAKRPLPTPVQSGPVQEGPFEQSSTSAMRNLLAAKGFSEIEHLRHKGDVFVAEAIGPGGQRMRVVIDAQTGELAGLRTLDQ